jgi:hypothetical protein
LGSTKLYPVVLDEKGRKKHRSEKTQYLPNQFKKSSTIEIKPHYHRQHNDKLSRHAKLYPVVLGSKRSKKHRPEKTQHLPNQPEKSTPIDIEHHYHRQHNESFDPVPPLRNVPASADRRRSRSHEPESRAYLENYPHRPYSDVGEGASS